jgi:hypothetical protein
MSGKLLSISVALKARTNEQVPDVLKLRSAIDGDDCAGDPTCAV